MFRLLTSRPLPFFVSKSFSSTASVAATCAAVKSCQSHNSYIVTHRMFHLLTSRPPLPYLCLEELLFRIIDNGDPCRRQERPVSQLLHSHPQNVSSLDISSSTPICLEELLFHSIDGGDPCRRQERQVSQSLHSHLKNVSSLDILSPPFLCIEELLFHRIGGGDPFRR